MLASSPLRPERRDVIWPRADPPFMVAPQRKTGQPGMSLERIRDEHRRWLERHDLLTRPWLVFGSAPEPTIPPDLASRAALICINNSGATAARLGLPPASLTLRNSHKEWKSVAHCSLPLVLWMSDDRFKSRMKLLFTPRARMGECRFMRKSERRDIYTFLLGSDLQHLGDMHKPSTGVFAVLYGLFLGVPEISVAGLSMREDGYSYGSQPGIQRHRAEDKFALTMVAEQYSSVSTTEIELSKDVGIPLHL